MTRTSRRSATARHERTLRRVALVSVVLLGVNFARFHGINGWDDTYYVGQLSSVVHDGDLDLRNDALFSDIAVSEVARLLSTLLPDGSLANTFSIGPALLWSPAYLVATALAASAPRWTTAHLVALHLLSLAFCVYVAWALARLGRRYGAARRDALWIAVGLLVASPLLVYGFRAYSMSHLPGAVAACWFLAALLATQRTRRPLWAGLAGVSLGCLAIVRWQDALYAVLIFPVAVHLARRQSWRRLGALLLAGCAGFVPVALLQSHAWWLERGTALAVPQGGTYLDFAWSDVRSFLLSGRSGFFPWMPLAALAFLGFLLPWRLRLDRSWRLSCLTLITLQVIVDASVADWWGGYSYGARRMTSLVPVLAIGLANLSRFGRGKRLRSAVVVAALWGFFTAGIYNRRVQDLSLVLLGRSSADAGAAQTEGLVADPQEARRLALKSPFRGSMPRYFADRPGGRFLTAVVIGVWLTLFSLVWLAKVRPESSLATVLVLYAALAMLAHLRLASGPRPDPAERRAWSRFTAGGPAAAPLPEAPAADAYRFLRAVRELEQGDPAAAGGLCELSRRGYNAARRAVEEHPELSCPAGPAPS